MDGLLSVSVHQVITMYCTVQDQYYTYTMFDVCGLYAVKVMLGEIRLPAVEEMERYPTLLYTVLTLKPNWNVSYKAETETVLKLELVIVIKLKLQKKLKLCTYKCKKTELQRRLKSWICNENEMENETETKF